MRYAAFCPGDSHSRRGCMSSLLGLVAFAAGHTESSVRTGDRVPRSLHVMNFPAPGPMWSCSHGLWVDSKPLDQRNELMSEVLRLLQLNLDSRYNERLPECCIPNLVQLVAATVSIRISCDELQYFHYVHRCIVLVLECSSC